jgi:trk system potassium uptake protein TrkH
MTFFDAVGHAFSTVAIGGMSTHDAGFAWFDNPTLEVIAIFFMIIAGINFAIHFTSWKRASAQPYFQDPELKVYASLLLGFAILTTFALYLNGTYGSISESARYAAFQVVSVMTTTGFSTTDFSLWPGFIPIMLICIERVDHDSRLSAVRDLRERFGDDMRVEAERVAVDCPVRLRER